MRRLISILFVFVAMAGCGSSSSGGPGGGGAGSCDWVTNGVRSQCTDFGAGWTAATARYACVAPQMIVAGPCPLTDSGGGCTITSATTTEIIWYYGAAYDAATVMTNCTNSHGSYVAP